MPTAFIEQSKSGKWRVRFRLGGRGTVLFSGGTMPTREAAEVRLAKVQRDLAAGVDPRGPLPESAVYFIASGGLTKIGYSAQLAGRFADLARTIPSEVDLLGWVPGSKALEIRMHQEFADHRRHGEWFDLPDGWRRRAARVAEARIETRQL